MLQIELHIGIRWLGIVPYCVYLLHSPVMGIVHGLMGNAEPALNSWADAGTVVISLIVTVCLAAGSYHCFEKRFMKLGHKLKYQWES